MEVSSHALELRRADAIHWDVAVFTNLSQDHLDFHPSMEDYFQAKRRLFAAGPRVMVVNVDDDYGRRLAAEFPDAITYSLDDVDDLEIDFTGSRFTFEGTRYSTPHPGAFNVLNALAAMHAARALGAGDATIAEALASAGRVPGRFEPVDEGQRFAVIVDYSHTPDSLANVLRAARDLADERVICVFGCGGDRDRVKRPVMGGIADELADVAIVTSDNPRSEDPRAIIDEIVAAMGEPVVEVDRRAAIARAVEAARPGDVVVIAGKGHEQGQEFADGRKEPFDDVTVAREVLRGARVDA
jgi:UDP-N-acetylmuramoyl-L-alanyl-D-glutamate--2,6-diaminopimelate ligase